MGYITPHPSIDFPITHDARYHTSTAASVLTSEGVGTSAAAASEILGFVAASLASAARKRGTEKSVGASAWIALGWTFEIFHSIAGKGSVRSCNDARPGDGSLRKQASAHTSQGLLGESRGFFRSS